MASRSAARFIRSPWKRAWRWILGPWSDPHTHLGSAARFVGLGAFLLLVAYTAACLWLVFHGHPEAKPDPIYAGELTALIGAALAFRAKSTQQPFNRMPAPDRLNDPPADPAPAAAPVPDPAATVAPAVMAHVFDPRA